MSNESGETAKPIEVLEYLSVIVDQMASIAWAKLGLQPDPITGVMGLDLEQARTAIDAVSALAPILESNLSEEDKRQVQNVVRDLKLNYLNKSKDA